MTLHKSPNSELPYYPLWFLSTPGNIKYLQSTYSLLLSFLDDRKLTWVISLCWYPSLLFWRCKIFRLILIFPAASMHKDHFGQVIPLLQPSVTFEIKSLLWFQGHFFPQASIPDALFLAHLYSSCVEFLTVPGFPVISTSGPLQGWLCHLSSFMSCHLHRKDSLNLCLKELPVPKVTCLVTAGPLHLNTWCRLCYVALKCILTYGQFFLFFAF